MRGVGEAGEGGKGVTDGVDSVTNVVTEDLLVVLALEQVVAVWVKAFVAVAAWMGLGGGWYNRELELALEEQGENVIGEAVVGEPAVVSGEGEAGEMVEESREHGFNVAGAVGL